MDNASHEFGVRAVCYTTVIKGRVRGTKEAERREQGPKGIRGPLVLCAFAKRRTQNSKTNPDCCLVLSMTVISMTINRCTVFARAEAKLAE